ncbi:hypothetical protein L484_008408 [Morus notabilis]|uniref:Uncharacterized protein n=1 Tax=Morus notabilis TaxID=981085 RepID=W9SGT9_9ROSA|nr:uncharacterized protein LOC21391776 [Morus notabilis]EXC31611.1 hypothetical protein L484_008408 [Morus notabilis]
MAAEISSSISHSPREINMNLNDDVQEMMLAKRGCCLWIPCFGRPDRSPAAGSIWWQRMRPAENDDPWWSRGWKKVREWSEIVAGPKWKTFIRRFNRNHRGFGYKEGGKFRYDELSYSLNFDEGPGQSGADDVNFVRRDFSSRYASVPASAKPLMDFGREGQGPSFA